MENTLLQFSQFFGSVHQMLLQPERFLMAAFALMLTVMIGMVLGPRAGNAHALVWRFVPALLGGVSERLYKSSRKTGDLAFRGFILCALSIVFMVVLGFACLFLIHIYPLYGLTEIVVLSLCMTSGSVWFTMIQLQQSVESGKAVKSAYLTLARTTRSNLTQSDDFTIIRRGIAMAAQTYGQGCATPIVLYIIGGLPLALIYIGVASLVWRFGVNMNDSKRRAYMAVPMAVHKLLGIIPSHLGGMFLMLSSITTPTASIAKSFTLIGAKKGKANYFEGGFILSAMAWVLNITLGGAYVGLDKKTYKQEWVGPEGASAQVQPVHLRRVLLLSMMAHLLLAAGLFGAYVWAQVLFA